MKQFRFLGLALLSLVALASATATSALAALPDFSLLTGEAYPWAMEASVTSKSVFESVSGEKVEGTAAKFKWELGELTALGKFTGVFTGVKLQASPCKTTGAGKEEVVFSGEFHVVLLVSGTSYGGLYSNGGLTAECGEPAKAKIKIKGALLTLFTKTEVGKDVTEMSGVIEGSKGKSNVTEYLNSEGKAVKVSGEVNFGLGNEQAMLNISGEVPSKILGGKMVALEKG